ncbi:MAG: zinc protease, partial [Variovorax sp.]|nr:zinc protease [Variovorax sp.]
MLSLKKTTLAFSAFAACAALLIGVDARAAIPIQHWTLANGAKVYLAATDALPIVDVQVDFDAGSRRDPAAQAGLAGVSASMVEKGVRANGGEPALDENALGEAWADLGASFNAGAGSERTSFSLRSLADPALLGKAVALAAREIGEPSFPADIWERERQQINAAIKEANTKPATIAGRTFAKLVYGTQPLGQETTEATLAAIDVAAMRQRYDRLIQPCRAKLSIVGAVTRPQADAIATQLLSRLPAATAGNACEP